MYKGIISILILSTLVSGCGAIKISGATGDASGSSGFTETLGAEACDEIHESTVLAGSSLSQTFGGSGDRAEIFPVTNYAGDHAEVGFDIKKSEKYSGSYTLSPETANYAQATEKLDVSNADSINAFAGAWSRDGRAAQATAMIEKGSLVGYSNSAYATSKKATVSQKAKSASGVGNMWFGERAGIFNGDFDEDNLVVFAGDKSIDLPDLPPGSDQLADYSGSASALKDSCTRASTIGSLSSSYIFGGPAAWNKDANGNVLTSSDTVILMTNGQISKYAEEATATRNSAHASMKMGSAKEDAFSSVSNVINLEGDNVNSKMEMGTGSFSGYSVDLTSAKTSATSSLDASATCAIGANIIFDTTAYNKEGDHIRSWAELYGGLAPYSGSFSSYSNDATVKPTSATIKQSAKSTTGDLIEYSEESYNKEGDKSTASASIKQGTLSSYSDEATAKLASATIKRSATSTSGNLIEYSDESYNNEGDRVKTTTHIAQGKLSGYSDLSTAQIRDFVSSKVNINSATGSSVEIRSKGSDNAPGWEQEYTWNPDKINPETKKNGDWDSSFVRHNAGVGDFGAKGVKFKNVEVYTTATLNDVNIAAKGFGSNTALILDPLRYELVDDTFNQQKWYDSSTGTYKQAVNPIDIRDPIMDTLENAGYAVTYYSDAAVSPDKVNQMTKYKVSAIIAHGDADSKGVLISKSASNGASTDPDPIDVRAKDFKYTNSKGMIIIVACDAFKNTGSGTLAAKASKAKCEGGPDIKWQEDYGRTFLIDFFKSMANGKSASTANVVAGGLKGPYLNLNGNFYL